MEKQKKKLELKVEELKKSNDRKIKKYHRKKMENQFLNVSRINLKNRGIQNT